MGRPKGKKKKTAAVPEASVPPTEEEEEDDAERRRFVVQQRLFNDREVQCRIAATEAIRDAEIENLLSRLRLLRSCLSKEQLETPALQFFKENFPSLSVIEKKDDKIFELEWKENVGGGSSLPSDLGPGFSAHSFRLNLLEAVQSKIPGSAFETPCLGIKDGLQTPGATTHRLSVGMTPKTLRLPKHGEMMLSVHGSPLGVFGEDNLEAIHESGGSPHSTPL